MKYTDHVEHYKLDAEYYDFFTYDKFMEQEHRRRYESIFNLLKVKENENILEIGSGAGHALKHIKSSKYFPLDVSTHNLIKIKSKTEKKVFPTSGDVFNLPFASNSFDKIILSEVLEHLDDPPAALKEIFRVLNSGGKFLVSVPYKQILTYQICIHCNKPTPTLAHLHSFDKEKLSSMLSNAGFKIIKSYKFLNKAPHRLHVYRLLKFLPYSLWKFLDSSITLLIDKPCSIMILGSK